MTRSYFRSFGFYVPPKVVTNQDLEKVMETSDEWIQQRSGIKERRWVEPGETSASMALKASQDALKKAGLGPNDIDMIIHGCLISDYVFPGGGVLLQRDLGCTKPIPALDIRNQCSSFLYSLSIADAWIRTGMYKRILIVGSEIHSTSLDISTRGRDVSVLFGDGAGAAIVEATSDDSTSYILDTILASEGQHAEKLYVKEPSSSTFPRLKMHMDFTTEIYPVMDGRFVFKNAVTRMCESVMEILGRNKLSRDDVKFVVAHQANMRINQMVLDQLGIPFEKTHHTLDRYGNTTAATIPITMNEAIDRGMIKRGDLVVLVAFGSGFTWGASLLKY